MPVTLPHFTLKADAGRGTAGMVALSRARLDVCNGWKADIRDVSLVPCHPAGLSKSVLRDIGWREWDPIGLSTPAGGWEGGSIADEYDRYLLHVAARLQDGEADDPLVDYLVQLETEHMGLS